MISGIVLGMARRQQRKGRASEQSIDGGGRQIHEKGGQIKPLTDRRRDVESQSMGDMSYMVPFGCGKAACAARDRKGVQAHMAAAGYMLPKEAVSSPKGRLIIGEAGLKCPGCGKSMC